MAAGTPAEAAVRRVVEAISGRDEPGFESLSPDAKLLRAFDLAGVAISTLPRVRPLALLIDDVQWADDDTLRMLRYVVRSDADQPIFLFLTIRPDEFATVTEAVNFVADMERMGLVRRLRPGRFGSFETAELLKRVLGGPVEASSAAAMHVQSEGVPFIVEELARTHREAGTLQQIDGEWRLGRNAARLVPSAVRTLIDRRAARLPARTRAALGDAAILGRSFSLRDLRAIRARIGDGDIASDVAARDGGNGLGDGADLLADDLEPAVAAGLLLEQAAGGAGGLHVHPRAGPPVRREPALGRPAAGRSMPRWSTCCSRAATRPRPGCRCSPSTRSRPATPRAPRDSRSTPRRPPSPRTPPRRRSAWSTRRSRSSRRRPTGGRCSSTRDDAYAALRKTGERLDGLTELAALAEAMRDPDDRARRPAPPRVGAADEPRRGRRRRARRPRPRSGAANAATPRWSCGRTSSSARRSCGPRWASRTAAPRPRPISMAPRRRIAAPSSSPSRSVTIAASPPPCARSG